ncbi:hypothetical protein FRC08_016249 [Ceratobasidium sp. 394]|nr:hypothetical protein FRC08_016249 [Ceratobasidium sp. 394]
MSKRIIVTVTRDAETYFIANITGYTDAQSIRKRIFSQLRIPDNLHSTFALYRTELGALAIGSALDDSQLLVTCWQFGDEIGSLKFIAQSIGSSTPKTNFPPTTPSVAPTPRPLPDPFLFPYNVPTPQRPDRMPVTASQPVPASPIPQLYHTEADNSQSPAPSGPDLSPPDVTQADGADYSAANFPNIVAGIKPNPSAPRITLQDQQQTTPNWVKGRLIARGTFTRIYLATKLATGDVMAVKQVNLPQNEADWNDSGQTSIVESLRTERDILRELDHPHIVRYLGFEQTFDTLSIFMEYVPSSLADQLRNYGKLEDEVSRLFSRQVIDGLVYLHTLGILHCNLKCGNILVDPSGLCKISGFGVAERNENAYENFQGTMMQGTIFWMAPEMLHSNNNGYSAKIDVWSMGCTTLEMLSGERPWAGDDMFAVMYKVGGLRQAPPTPDSVHSTLLARDFRTKCFATNPDERPTAAELQLHPWLENNPGWIFKGFERGSVHQSPQLGLELAASPLPRIREDDLATFNSGGGSSDDGVENPHLRSKTPDSLSELPPSHRSDRLARNPVPISPSTVTVEIGSTMPVAEIIQHLVLHGCQDITVDLDLPSCSEYPISTGGFGDVYRGRLESGQGVAIKCMRIIDLSSDGQQRRKHLKYAAREIHTWSRLQHPHVLKLLGLAEYRNQIAMVSPWLEGGALRNYLAQHPEVNRPQLCVQIADGLSYLHQCGVVHGDLKGDNVLISDAGDAMLTDFGNAVLQERTLQFTYTTAKVNVSLRWAAPELLGEDASHSIGADIFALGMTILETITGNIPYTGVKDVAVMFAIMQNRPPKRPEAHIPTKSKYGNFIWWLLNRCWASDPGSRPTAEQVRKNMGLVQPDDLVGR